MKFFKVKCNPTNKKCGLMSYESNSAHTWFWSICILVSAFRKLDTLLSSSLRAWRTCDSFRCESRSIISFSFLSWITSSNSNRFSLWWASKHDRIWCIKIAMLVTRIKRWIFDGNHFVLANIPVQTFLCLQSVQNPFLFRIYHFYARFSSTDFNLKTVHFCLHRL